MVVQIEQFVHTHIMSRPAKTTSSLPGQVERCLEKLGADLRIARERRGESLRSWSARIGVSVPTLQRLETGDPSVGVSAYAVALWLIGRVGDLENLADPAKDQQALSQEILKSSRKERRRNSSPL
jgi:transcriptional regulator with XRE-family HTH domain